MKLVYFLVVFFMSFHVWGQARVVVDVKITPAGSFKAETKEVTGAVVVKGTEVQADKIVVSLKNLDSGISLRDNHMRNKYLEVAKFPEAILTMAKGRGGQGTGTIKIKGIEKPVKGTYQIKGSVVEANFDLKISDFGITGVKYMGAGVGDTIKLTAVVPVKK